MATATAPSVKYRTPLRQAQRDLTRSRIKDAARNLFYENHYDSTTMDEIALAAGLRRSTLYLHYKDKAEILAEIIADYHPRARAILATLPGPHPSRPQIEKWIGEVIKFVAKEQVPFSIMLELPRNKAHGFDLDRLTSELLAGIGNNNPPFADAADDKADPMLRARALLLFQELTFACEVHLNNAANPCGKAMLKITAEDFHAFLSADK